MTLSIMLERFYAKCCFCSVSLMLSVECKPFMLCRYAECQYAECRYAECPGAEFCVAECYWANSHCAKDPGTKFTTLDFICILWRCPIS